MRIYTYMCIYNNFTTFNQYFKTWLPLLPQSHLFQHFCDCDKKKNTLIKSHLMKDRTCLEYNSRLRVNHWEGSWGRKQSSWSRHIYSQEQREVNVPMLPARLLILSWLCACLHSAEPLCREWYRPQVGWVFPLLRWEPEQSHTGLPTAHDPSAETQLCRLMVKTHQHASLRSEF